MLQARESVLSRFTSVGTALLEKLGSLRLEGEPHLPLLCVRAVNAGANLHERSTWTAMQRPTKAVLGSRVLAVTVWMYQ